MPHRQMPNVFLPPLKPHMHRLPISNQTPRTKTDEFTVQKNNNAAQKQLQSGALIEHSGQS